MSPMQDALSLDSVATSVRRQFVGFWTSVSLPEARPGGRTHDQSQGCSIH
jgi:hypothetical protein